MMAYDSVRDKAVVFGGLSSHTSSLQETWEWDGINWTSFDSSPNGPEARAFSGMAFNAKSEKVVLFGGGSMWQDYMAGKILDDTWEWNGNHWTRIEVEGPSARMGKSLVYDSKRDVMVIFGGAVRPPDINYPLVLRVQETWIFRYGSSGMPLGLWSKYH